MTLQLLRLNVMSKQMSCNFTKNLSHKTLIQSLLRIELRINEIKYPSLL